jgi:hypothetical protein
MAIGAFPAAKLGGKDVLSRNKAEKAILKILPKKITVDKHSIMHACSFDNSSGMKESKENRLKVFNCCLIE